MKTETQTPHQFLVVDDHEVILQGTVPALQEKYPDAQIKTAKDRQTALAIIELYGPDLVLLDLSIPPDATSPARPEVGLAFLETLIQGRAAPNVMVLSTDVKPLVRLKSEINTYGGGFAAIDKSVSIDEMLRMVELALRGSIHLPPQVRSRSEFDSAWLQVLTLRFEEGLTDKAIAKRLEVSDRTIRNYWTRMQDFLCIGEEPDKDVRIQIAIEARKMGLIS
ncbi:MAG: response regulator transcription factor [Leptolyngbya sp. SIO1E4]|nr:response regulator transcription factor [Leptolyngbya sp. SIO1E4]